MLTDKKTRPCGPGCEVGGAGFIKAAGFAQARPRNRSALVDGAGNTGEGGVELDGAFADDGANRVVVAELGPASML
jgi:hypothetical protein